MANYLLVYQDDSEEGAHQWNKMAECACISDNSNSFFHIVIHLHSLLSTFSHLSTAHVRTGYCHVDNSSFLSHTDLLHHAFS